MKKIRVLLLPISLLLSIPNIFCNELTDNTANQNICTAQELAQLLQTDITDTAKKADSIEFSFRIYRSAQHDEQAWQEIIEKAVISLEEMEVGKSAFVHSMRSSFDISDENEMSQKGIHGQINFSINCDSCGDEEKNDKKCPCITRSEQGCECTKTTADGQKGVCMCSTRLPDGCVCVKEDNCTSK